MTISEADFRAAILDAAKAAREASNEAILAAVMAFADSDNENLNNWHFRAGVNQVINILERVTK